MLWQEMAFAAAGNPSGGGEAGGALQAFLPLIILFVIFYFLLIRPQQKRAKEHREMLGSLQKGEYVITSGGLYGRITAISEEDVLTLDLGNSVEVKVNRNYISSRTEKKVLSSGKKG